MIQLILSLLLALQTETPHPAGDEYVLTFQVRPDARAETLDLIARVGESQQRTVAEPMTLEQVAYAEYGTTYKVITELKQANQGKPYILEKDTQISLPAAPKWRLKRKIEVPLEASLADYACLNMGTCGSTTLGNIENANKASIKALENRKTVILPYIAEIVSVRLKKGFESEAENILAALRKDPAVERAEINQPFELIPGIGEAELTSGACTSSSQTPSPIPQLSWFTSAPPPKKQVIVAILDSGVPLDETRFQFWENVAEKEGKKGEDEDGNFFFDDVIGTDVLLASVGGGYPLDDIELPAYKSHGTHIAGLASGRGYEVAERLRIDERLRLMILKIADSNAKVHAGAAAEGMSYAVKNKANIINMSFAGDFSGAMEFVIEKSPQVLFVTAAGNSPTPVDLTTLAKGFPARFATKWSNVISVGASDSAPKLACFSNFGKAVDVVAPGVAITSTMRSGTGSLSGTSQATPWVTLTATLLYSMGVTEPPKIRSRIMATVDFVPELINKVRAEGAVNMEKAAAFEDDLIVMVNNQLVRGTLQGFGMVSIACNGEQKPLTDAVRIVLNHSAPATERGRIWIGDAAVPCVTSVPFTQVAFRKEGNTSMTNISAVQIREVIPRMR